MMNMDWQHAGPAAPAHGLAEDYWQRDEIFDPAAVLERFREAGIEGDARHCRLLNVRHVPRRSLRVIYRLSGGSGGERIYCVDLDRRGSAMERRDGTLPMPRWGARALRFPADPGLPGLPQLVDPGALADRLAPVLGEAHGGDMAWSLLAWFPGERAAVRQDWPGQCLVAKLHAEAASSYRAMQALWVCRGRRFHMAEPLLLAPELPARWERFVPGERIETRFGSEPLTGLLEQVTAGLVGLHASDLPGLPRCGEAEVLRRLERNVLARIGNALPDLAREGAAFAERLAARTPSSRPTRMIHGDLHTANLLLTGEGVVFIDLDGLAYGDPAFDLALLGTRLVVWAMNRGEGGEEIAAGVAALPELYARAGGAEVPAAVYAWYVAALLVGRQIKSCMRHLAPEFAALAPRLMTAAQSVLAAGRVDAAALAA